MRNKLATQQKILDTAIRLFNQKGFVKVSTLEIARASSIAHGTVFFHFPNRSELIIASIYKELGKLAEELNEKSRDSYDIEKLCNIFLDGIDKHRRFYSQLVKDLPHLPLKVQRMVFASFSGFSVHFVQAIELAQSNGKARQFDAKYAIFFWFGVVNYLFTYSKLLGTSKLSQTDRDEITSFFMASLTNPK